MFYFNSVFNNSVLNKLIEITFHNNELIIFMEYTKNTITFEFYDRQKFLSYKKDFQITLNLKNKSDFLENDLKSIAFLLNHYLLANRKIVFITDLDCNFFVHNNISFFSSDLFQKKLIKIMFLEQFFNYNYFENDLLNKKNIINTFSVISSFYNFDFLYKNKTLNYVEKIFKMIKIENSFENEKEYERFFNEDKELFSKKSNMVYYDNYDEFITKFQVSSLPNEKNISKVLDTVIPLKNSENGEKTLAIYHPNNNILNYYAKEIVLVSEKILMKLLFNNNLLTLKFNFKTNLKLLINYSLFNKVKKIVLKQNFDDYLMLLFNEDGTILTYFVDKKNFRNFFKNSKEGIIKEKRTYYKDTKFILKKGVIENSSYLIIDKINKIFVSQKNICISNDIFYSDLEKNFFNKVKEELKIYKKEEIGYICDTGNILYVEGIIYLGKEINENLIQELGIKKIIEIMNYKLI